jgi:hypothetical protein
MKTFVFCLVSVCFAQTVLAQNTPVQKYGTCPMQTFASGDACVPVNDAQVFWNGGERCPIGWTRSQQYCVR